MIKTGVFLVVLLTIAEGKLPSFFKKCDKLQPDLNQCLTDNANQGWSEFVKGDPNYHITSLSPLENVALSLNINDKLRAKVTNATIAGIEDIHFDSIKLDFSRKYFVVKFSQPIFNIYGDYEVSGDLLGNPIEGKGSLNHTYYDGTYTYFFKYDLVPKKEKHLIKITGYGLTMDVQKVRYNLDNLFDGNAVLGEKMNKFMNDYWFFVHEFSKGSLGNEFGRVYSNVLSEFFKKVTMEDLF